MGGRGAARKCSPVTASGNWNAARSQTLRDGLTAIVTSVVCNDDFTGEPEAPVYHLQRLVGVGDACWQTVSLVEARHDNRHVDVSPITDRWVRDHVQHTFTPSEYCDQKICPIAASTAGNASPAGSAYQVAGGRPATQHIVSLRVLPGDR